MENKNGSGVFLGVISVATLVVAIIGATFAFFSTQTGSEEDAVNVATYEFATTVQSVERVYPTDDTVNRLIPLNPSTAVGDTNNLLYAINTAGCIDSNQHMVCALYKVTLENAGATASTLNLEVKTNTNNGLTDLTFQALSGAAGTFTVPGTIAAVTLADIASNSVGINGFSIEVPAKAGDVNGTAEHYFVVYLNDNNDVQNTQMAKTFTGQLVYTSSDGSNRLTGTFNVTG